MPMENEKSSEEQLEKIRLEIRQLRNTRYIPWLTMILTISSTLFGFWKVQSDLRHQLTRDIESRNQDFRRSFFDARRSVYMETAKAVGTIAALNANTPERKSAEQTFKRLYWSDMVVVEDEAVKNAMKAFHDCLEGESEGCRDKELAPNTLRTLAIKLSSALRLSLGNVPETQWLICTRISRDPMGCHNSQSR